MYSAKSFEVTKEEFNYLLPVLKDKLLQTGYGYFFISHNIETLTDMLDRLKGLYNYYDSINSLVVYACSKQGSLNEFRNLFIPSYSFFRAITTQH